MIIKIQLKYYKIGMLVRVTSRWLDWRWYCIGLRRKLSWVLSDAVSDSGNIDIFLFWANIWLSMKICLISIRTSQAYIGTFSLANNKLSCYYTNVTWTVYDQLIVYSDDDFVLFILFERGKSQWYIIFNLISCSLVNWDTTTCAFVFN